MKKTNDRINGSLVFICSDELFEAGTAIQSGLQFPDAAVIKGEQASGRLWIPIDVPVALQQTAALFDEADDII